MSFEITKEKVDGDTPLTEKPVLDLEESPIAPPAAIPEHAVGCAEFGYRNGLEWKTCNACGVLLLPRASGIIGPAIKTIASFDGRNPFSGGVVVAARAPEGHKALLIDRSYVSLDQRRDWLGTISSRPTSTATRRGP